MVGLGLWPPLGLGGEYLVLSTVGKGGVRVRWGIRRQGPERVGSGCDGLRVRGMNDRSYIRVSQAHVHKYPFDERCRGRRREIGRRRRCGRSCAMTIGTYSAMCISVDRSDNRLCSN